MAGAFGSGWKIYCFLSCSMSCTTTMLLFLLGSTNHFYLRSTIFESAAASSCPTSSRNQHHMVAPATPLPNRTKPPSISLGGLLLLYSPSWRHMVVMGWCFMVQRFMMIAGLTHADTQQKKLSTTATAIQPTIWAMPPPAAIGVRRLPCILVWMGTIADGLTLQWDGLWAQTEHWAAWLEWIGNHCSSSFGIVLLIIGLFSAAASGFGNNCRLLLFGILLFVPALFPAIIFLCTVVVVLQLINGIGLLGILLSVERLVWRFLSYLLTDLSYTFDGIMAPCVVLADFGQALGGIMFLSRYYQEPNYADMIHHFMLHSTHDFTATHRRWEYFHEGLLGHLFKVLVTYPLEYGRESAGLSTTILYCYFGYFGFLIQITSEWPSFLQGIYFRIGGVTVAASGGYNLPSHFYHICFRLVLLAASALFLAFGYLPKDLWFCIVLFSRVDFLSLSSSEEPSRKLIFLLYRVVFSLWTCPSDCMYCFF